MTPATAAGVTLGQTLKLIPTTLSPTNSTTLVTGTCAQVYSPGDTQMLFRYQDTTGTYVKVFHFIANLST